MDFVKHLSVVRGASGVDSDLLVRVVGRSRGENRTPIDLELESAQLRSLEMLVAVVDLEANVSRKSTSPIAIDKLCSVALRAEIFSVPVFSSRPVMVKGQYGIGCEVVLARRKEERSQVG